MSKPSVTDLQHAIRQQTIDLQEELAALSKWQDDIIQKNKYISKSRTDSEIPIRGTEPILAAPAKPAPNVAETAKEQGNEYFRKGELADAIRLYTKGIEADPSGPTAHLLYANRAICHLRLSSWEAAEADATRCVELNRTYAKGYFRRAKAKRALGNLRDARKDLETVLALNPNDSETTAELKAITMQIHQEDKKNQSINQKKKLVIEEVDEEIEEEVQVPTKRVELEPVAPSIKKPTVKQSVIRSNPNVEEIEDDPVPQSKNGATHDNTSAKREGKPLVKKAEYNKQPSQTKPIVDDLRAPRNFSEFERFYNEVRRDKHLLYKYFSLIIPESMTDLFAASLTSELLTDLCDYASQATPSLAYAILLALSKLDRLEEVLMFLSDSEAHALRVAIAHASSSGQPMDPINQTFVF